MSAFAYIALGLLLWWSYVTVCMLFSGWLKSRGQPTADDDVDELTDDLPSPGPECWPSIDQHAAHPELGYYLLIEGAVMTMMGFLFLPINVTLVLSRIRSVRVDEAIDT